MATERTVMRICKAVEGISDTSSANATASESVLEAAQAATEAAQAAAESAASAAEAASTAAADVAEAISGGVTVVSISYGGIPA